MGSDECIHEEDKNNWGGLQAIVHPITNPPPPSSSSSSSSMAAAATTTRRDLLFHIIPNSFDVSHFDDGDDDHDVFVGFPSSSNDDALLEELYKPFYHHHHLPNSFSAPENEAEDRDDHKMKGCFDPRRRSTPKAPAPKYKKRNRKNEQNRVVIEVGAEELCKDQWAWRKYGQKPIKGSPYPRSYYRCSSSKGCLARKQVERSNSKAGKTFVVTYTAEHSHSQPTRRNSLAGTIRNKFIILPPPPAAAASPSSSDAAATATPPRPLIPPSSVSDPLSPSDYNSSACNEAEGVAMQREPETAAMMAVEENGEDFFAGLEDLDGLLSQFYYPSSSSSSSSLSFSSSSHDHHHQYHTSFPPSMFSS